MNRALLVGINAYPGAPLRGCANDITDMTKLLVDKVGFQVSDIRLLVDERASTQEIKSRIEWLILGLKEGDRVLFHYSGHGAQYADRNNSGDVSALHDVICPVDFDWSQEKMITDSDFKKMFAAIPKGVEFNWISDSCHSGDLAKALIGARPEPGEGYRVPRLFPTPADMQWRIDTALSKGMRAVGLAVEHLYGALVAGCKSDETSADAFVEGRYNGALTYALIKQLAAADGMRTALSSTLPRVQSILTARGFTQHPQLRGEPLIIEKPFLAA